jgi:hypothetical protein
LHDLPSFPKKKKKKLNDRMPKLKLYDERREKGRKEEVWLVVEFEMKISKRPTVLRSFLSKKNVEEGVSFNQLFVVLLL